jgi:hypothetical protein
VPIINIDHLAPGMMLRSSVCDRSGRMLLPGGNELTEKHLRIFRTWGIIEADIEGDDSGDTAHAQPLSANEVDPMQLTEAETAIAGLFVHNDMEHPAIIELMRICTQRKIDHAS